MLTRARFEGELKQAMRSQDDLRRRTLRMILSAIQLAEVERRGELDEPALLGLLQKEVKSRQETIADAEKAGRNDLVHAAADELTLLQSYLPQALDPEQLKALVQEAIASVGAKGPQDMGKVMKDLMPKVQGRADGKAVSTMVRDLLTPS
ncbi:MAG TPA: GatB/YqeY domain-containing protein [Anaerolineales bacterium]|nr:GatB/YqeY domain-containing protein [Anaerolineales bacterium]